MIPRFRVWLRRGGAEGAIAASGLAVLLLAVFLTGSLWVRERRRVWSGGAIVDLTLLENAEEKGARKATSSSRSLHDYISFFLHF